MKVKYCIFPNGEKVNAGRFNEIKEAICFLFSHKDTTLIALYKKSLDVLYSKAMDTKFIINKHIYPLETICLKDRKLIMDDEGTLAEDVKLFINYLIYKNPNGTFELLDEPIKEKEFIEKEYLSLTPEIQMPLIGEDN